MKPKSSIPVFALAILVFIACVVGSTWLLISKSVSEASFVILILISLAAACLIGFYGSIEFIKVSDFEIKFREVKESEEKVKKLAADVVVLVEAVAKHAIVDEGFDQAAFDKARDEIEKNTG